MTWSYWALLNEGWDAVLGSRFVKGDGVIDYPWVKLRLNQIANLFIRVLFGIKLNDFTNAFKAYRRTTIDGCRPFLSPHFKTILRGYSWTVIAVTWWSRKTGESRLKIKEMGSRYLFIVLYMWLEKHFSRGDYRRQIPKNLPEATPPSGLPPACHISNGGVNLAELKSTRNVMVIIE